MAKTPTQGELNATAAIAAAQKASDLMRGTDEATMRVLRDQASIKNAVAALPDAYTPASMAAAMKIAEATRSLKIGSALEASRQPRYLDNVTEALKAAQITQASLNTTSATKIAEELARAYSEVQNARSPDPYTSPMRLVFAELGSGKSGNSGPLASRASASKPSRKIYKQDSPNALPAPVTSGSPVTVAEIGQRVRLARKAMGMTQQRFADLTGVGRRFLVELEHGKPSLEIGRVFAVCHAAGIKLGFMA